MVLLSSAVEVVALLFVGMWLSKNVVASVKVAPAKDYAQFNPSVDDEATRLTRLKELLDAGILTQEEYDDKKKQILEYGFDGVLPKVVTIKSIKEKFDNDKEIK